MTLHNEMLDETTVSQLFVAIGALYLVSLKWNNSALKVVFLVARVLFVLKLVDSLIGSMALPSRMGLVKREASELIQRGWQPVTVPTPASKISAGVLNKNHDKWLLFLQPNGVVFEQTMPYLEVFERNLDVNVVAFNYRGVGRSTGDSVRGRDLVDDGTAVIRHIQKEYGVDGKKLIIYGWSIGGAVAAQLPCQGCLLVVDRGFSKLSQVAGSLEEDITFNVALGSGLWMAAAFAGLGWQRFPLMGAAVMGTVVSLAGGNKHLAPYLINSIEWEIDALQDFRSGANGARNTVVIYHKHDGVINYETASFYQGLDELGLLTRDDIHSFELTSYNKTGNGNHMYLLYTQQEEYAELCELIKGL